MADIDNLTLQVTPMTNNALMWATFAQAALTGLLNSTEYAGADVAGRDAAGFADAMLREYEKRFPPQPTVGAGHYPVGEVPIARPGPLAVYCQPGTTPPDISQYRELAAQHDLTLWAEANWSKCETDRDAWNNLVAQIHVQTNQLDPDAETHMREAGYSEELIRQTLGESSPEAPGFNDPNYDDAGLPFAKQS